jgi:RNA 3'-terminal phosphate cyclase
MGDCSDQVHSDQMVLRQEAGPRERQLKALKAKLIQGGPSGSSPLRSDGSRDGQAWGWTLWEAAKMLTGELRTSLGTKGPSQKTGKQAAKKKGSTYSFSG